MKSLKISELVGKLVQLQAQNGDLEVIIVDTADNEFPIRERSFEKVSDPDQIALVLG